mmetsp:Transcript_617/g.1266  ORF Transcript_617/g.1266 Transcript_617/m.1266 type:complete len:207 (+) Transcript_617:99-719(+)
MTATLDELKEALIETLHNRGVLGQVKAKVRAEIFAALDDEDVARPSLPRENVVINELIREYLEYNGYHHTLSVLMCESGHPEERQFDRRFLASELKVVEDERSRSLPLIYGMMRGLQVQETAADKAAEAEIADAIFPSSAYGQPPAPDMHAAGSGLAQRDSVDQLEPLVIRPSTREVAGSGQPRGLAPPPPWAAQAASHVGQTSYS